MISVNRFEYEMAYFEQFGEQFPNMMVSGDAEIEIIKQCLKNDKPYVPKTNKDALY